MTEGAPKFELVHDKHTLTPACGGVGFRCAVNPELTPETWPKMEQIFLLDGSHPKFGDPVICGSCGLPIFNRPDMSYSAREIR